MPRAGLTFELHGRNCGNNILSKVQRNYRFLFSARLTREKDPVLARHTTARSAAERPGGPARSSPDRQVGENEHHRARLRPGGPTLGVALNPQIALVIRNAMFAQELLELFFERPAAMMLLLVLDIRFHALFGRFAY
jgi:hypothetical protein